jgi:hypothetical protein
MFEYAELLKGDLWARLVIGVVDPKWDPKSLHPIKLLNLYSLRFHTFSCRSRMSAIRFRLQIGLPVSVFQRTSFSC